VVIALAGGATTGVDVRVPGARTIKAPNAKGGTRRWNVTVTA
jgi:hypothetical protein